MTTIKVSVELRDRIAALAEREQTTLAGAIARSLDAAADAEFWAGVARTMGEPDSRARGAIEAEQFAGDLTDGLDPDETWDDVW